MTIEGGETIRKMILTVAVLLLLTSIPLAVAQPHPGEADGTDFGVGPKIPNPMHLLVAWDEEMAATDHEWLDASYSAKIYASYQVRRAAYYFPFSIQIRGFDTWDSEDSLGTAEMLWEAIQELNWVPGAVRDDGKRYDLLVLFTAQDNDNTGGVASWEWKALIAKTQHYWVLDDNLVKHELGHLFGLSHCTEHCSMNNASGEYYTLYNEPLHPIHNGICVISYFGWQYHAYMVYEWCPLHAQRLRQIGGMLNRGYSLNLALSLLEPEFDEDLFIDQDSYENVPDAKGRNPYLPLAILGIIVAVIVAVYIYKRSKKKE